MEIRDVLTTNKHTHIRVATKKGKSRPKLRLFFSAWSRNMAVGYNVCEKFQVNEKVLKKKHPSVHYILFHLPSGSVYIIWIRVTYDETCSTQHIPHPPVCRSTDTIWWKSHFKSRERINDCALANFKFLCPRRWSHIKTKSKNLCYISAEVSNLLLLFASCHFKSNDLTQPWLLPSFAAHQHQ